MANSRLNYQIAWSPHEGSNLFLLGSSNNLRLYEYLPKGSTNLKFESPVVNSMAAMTSMRCFAWSSDPSPSCPILIAAGFANSKIYLIDLSDESILSESQKTTSSSLQQQPYTVLNSKNSRPCNNVAFSLTDTKLLATGFEKNRNEFGLLIWDVEKAGLSSSVEDKDFGGGTFEALPNRTNSMNVSKNDRDRVGFFCRVDEDPLDVARFKFAVYEPPLVPKPLPAPRYDTHSDAINSFGQSENVNSISWFPARSKQLVVGMSGRYLKIFDLRTQENSTITISTKAVLGVKTDPYNDHRFASFEEIGYTGNICLWDDRKTAEAVLSVPTETRLVQISFSTSQPGLLASLSNDASYISLYDIKETRNLRRFSTTLSPWSDEVDHDPNGFGGDRGMTTMKPSIMGGGFVPPVIIDYNEKNGGGSTFNSGREELDMPVLWKSRKTQRSSKSLASFAWIPTISTSYSQRLLAINKEQTFETISLEECPNFDWEPRGNISIFGQNSYTYNVDQKIQDHGGLEREDINNNNGNVQNQDNGNHKPRVSLDLKVDNDYYSGYNGNRTPRRDDLNGSSKYINTLLKGIIPSHDDLIEKDDEKELMLPLKVLKDLQEDISVVMRKRAKEGYSMTCRINEEIVRDSPKLKALWSWIAHAEKSALEGRNSDFNFQGIHVVWTASTSKKTSPLSTPKASPPRSSERFDQAVDANELTITASTSKLPQRKLALTICGWGFGKKELEETLQRLERDGNYEKAAALALFHGKTERAITALNNSRDERLKLVSTTLAGYAVSIHDLSSQPNSIWSEMCRRLSLEMRDPYLRAMFSYIASGNWMDVLQEEELSLQDRIGIALRFLDDEELNVFLHKTTAKVVAGGDIGGVILTGLTQEGVSLFENYINNTCDVQTASLAMSFCVPKKFKDERVNSWIENYRMLLDKWKMFDTRARFDIARGKHRVSSTSSAADMVPPQVYVRCNFCSQSISHSLWIFGTKKDGNKVIQQFPGIPGPGMMYRQKATCCPGCLKPLPRCSICLLSLGTPAEEATTANLQNGSSNDKPSGFDLWFTWCQSCRHGGHAIHMLQWFEKHKVCPVSECTCECEITK